MTGKRVYGHTKAGEPVTDEMIEQLADEADRGYELGQLKGHRRGPGRPPLGEAAKSVESVRLEPALRDDAARRAEEEGITVSELIRRAIRQYLKSA
jgi:CRISPR-associated endonuclease/helicase Cas3